MNAEDEIKRDLGVVVKILENVTEKLGDLQKEHEKAKPDLPDNTLPNAPVICSNEDYKKLKRYFASSGYVFRHGYTESTAEAYTTQFSHIEIDRNHGEDNHWLPWDGKDELPPYVKPDDYMTVLLEAPDQDYEYRSCLARDVPWVCVTQYLWLERDSDE